MGTSIRDWGRRLHVESTNVTSMRWHWTQVMKSKADIACRQVTRLTALGHGAMSVLAKKIGWQAIWGAPLDPKGHGTWDTAPSGVGVLYCLGMVVQIAPKLMKDEGV